MKNLAPFAFFFLVTLAGTRPVALAQLSSATYQNALGFGSTGNDSGNAIFVDGSGNIFITGYFSGTVDFDPGASTSNLTSNGLTDIFVLKLNSSGGLIWAKQVGGANTDYGLSISVDGTGNVYTSGVANGSNIDFDPGTGTALRTCTIFTLKLDSNGDFLWVSTVSAGATGTARSVIDASGNVYVGGTFSGTNVDFSGGLGITMSSAGSTDAFAYKLNSSGSLLWTKRVGGTTAELGEAIELDPSGNVLLTGSFTGTADFDPDAGTVNQTSAGSTDLYLLKLNGSTGAYLDARRVGGTNADKGTAIKTDASGNVFLGGMFNGTVDFDTGTGTFNMTGNGSSTIFVEKLNSSFDFVWAKVNQGSSSNNLFSLALDAFGGIYLTGNFLSTVDFDTGTGTNNLTSSGRDIWVQKLNPDGALVWVYKFGSTTTDDNGCWIFADGSDNVFVTGTIQNTVDFDPGTATVNITSAGALDMYMLKLSNAASTLNITAQPSGTSVCTSNDATLTVTASGTSNITYQWQKFNTSLGAFEDLVVSTAYTGVTSTTMTVAGVSSITAGSFRVKVGGDFVSNVFSNAVTVNEIVRPAAPTVTGTTADSCTPTGHVLTATSPTAGTFNWYEKITNSSPYFSDATGSFTTPALSASMTYYAAFHDGTCESTRIPVTANVTYSGPGSVDYSFMLPSNSLSNASFIDDFEIQSDGKIVLNYLEEGGSEYFIARLLTDGSLDPGYINHDRNEFDAYVDLLEIQTDDKVVIAGRFTDFNGTNFGRILRFNTDGTVDATFNSAGAGFNAQVSALTLQTDGKILAAGSFTTYNGTAANRLIRLNTNGTIDGTFSAGTGPNVSAMDIILQPDGKILISGNFSTYNGAGVGTIVRLNSDGSLDGTFTSPTVTSPLTLALQTDGKVIVGGNFNTVAGATRNYIARLNTDGTHDTSFDSGTAFNSYVNDVFIDSNGKILVGGWFWIENGGARNFLARLRPDGSLDNFFHGGIGSYSAIFEIKAKTADKIYAAGYVDYWNGALHNGMALVNNQCALTPKGIDNTSCTGNITISACGGTNGQYRWYTLSSGGTALPGETNSTLTLSGLSATTTYYVSLADAVCESSRVPVVATITSGGSPPSVTPSTACSGLTQTLTASGGAAGEYRWYTVASGGSAIAGETNSTYTTPTLTSSTTYYVSIATGGCETSRQPVTATVSATPSAPGVTPGSTCGAGAVTLAASGGANGEYRWYTLPSGGTAITGETNSSYTTPSLSSSTTYYVALNNGTCESVRTSVTATVNSIPTQPNVIGGSRCGPGAVALSASGGTDGQYRWYTQSTGGTAISGEVNGSYTTVSLSATSTYYVSRNDGTCESPRAPVTATINTIPAQPTTTDASRCGSGTLTLTASGGTDGQYRWYTQSTGGTAISGEVNGSYTTVSLSATSTYYVSRNDGTCESPRAPVTATISPVPAPPESTNATACSGSSATLTATGGTTGNYRWYTQASGGSAISGEVNSTYTTPVLTSNTTFYVSILVGVCESNRTPVLVTVSNCVANTAPVINPSPLTTQIGASVTLNLLSIISDADGNLDPTTLQVVIQPSSGASASISSGTLFLDYTGMDFAGTDVLTIQACDNLGSCTQQQITVEVVGDIVVYNAVSPNGDGLNDILFIQYIELLPETQTNTVKIFNRWGDVIFDVSNYDNVTRVFRGLNNNGNEIPSGTYFYKIEFPTRKEVTGYLSLKR